MKIILYVLFVVSLIGLLIPSDQVRWAHQGPMGPYGRVECYEPALGTVYIRDDVIDSPLLEPVRAHERKHVEQMARFSSCIEADLWYDLNSTRVEAEAFCAMAEADVLHNGIQMDSAVAKYANWLSRAYGAGIAVDSASLLIREFCDG